MAARAGEAFAKVCLAALRQWAGFQDGEAVIALDVAGDLQMLIRLARRGWRL